MDLNDNTVSLSGAKTRPVWGKPGFNENGTDYEAATMRYNLKPKKDI